MEIFLRVSFKHELGTEKLVVDIKWNTDDFREIVMDLLNKLGTYNIIEVIGKGTYGWVADINVNISQST